MRCDRHVIASIFLPSVFAVPIGQTFFRHAQLRHKHEIETETETITQTYTDVETQIETVYVTEIYTHFPGSLPTLSSIEQTNNPEPKETKSLGPVEPPNPPDEEFSSDNGKFLGLFLAVIGVIALLTTVFFMLHRYRALQRRTNTGKGMGPSSPASSDKTMSDSPIQYLGGEELDRKETSITLLNGDSDDRSRVRIVETSERLQHTRVEKPSWLESHPPAALVGNGRVIESPRPLSMIDFPPSALKKESSPSPLRNMWRARSGFHTPVIGPPQIPATQSMSNIGDPEQYDVGCRRCEKLWLARPLSREWPKSP